MAGPPSDVPLAAAEVPEDVRAELDAEARRAGDDPTLTTLTTRANVIPEDVLSERDHEVRLSSEAVHQTLADGGLPPEDGEDQ